MSVFPTAPEKEDAYFELSFSPSVALVSTVRAFVTEFYEQLLSDAEATSRLAVATHELLENAVRYSIDGKTDVRIGLFRDQGKVTIDTRNRSQRPHIEALTRTVDELSAAEDPNAAYQVLMRRNVKRKDGSGLGLGRIWAESEMPISYRLEGDVVFLHAVASFEGARS